MEIKVSPQLFVDDKRFLINELNKKHTRQGFDDVQIVADSIYCFKINGKWNAATKQYIETHRDRKDYKNSIIFDRLIKFPNFVVLCKSNSLGIKVVKPNQSMFYETGKLLFCEPDRYVVIDSGSTIQVIYSVHGGAKELYMPTTGANFVQVEDENDPASQKYSFTNLTEATKFLNVNEYYIMFDLLKHMLADDAYNFYEDNPKFVLLERGNPNEIVEIANKSIDSYHIAIKKVQFKSKEQFSQNEKNLLKFYRTQILLAKERQKQQNQNS